MSNASEEATKGEVEDIRRKEKTTRVRPLRNLVAMEHRGGKDARKDESSRSLGKEGEENGDHAA